MTGIEALRAVFLPLIDAAPLVVARELGFAAEEGITLELIKAPSWSVARDLLNMGQVDMAHLLAPIPVATALGLGASDVPLLAVMVMSINGTIFGVSRSLAERMRIQGYPFDFTDAAVAGKALLAAADTPLRIGVPFPFSMHAEHVHFWLGAVAPAHSENWSVRTIPPPRMAEALRAGEIDAFCVGEPWGSIAVEIGAGELLLPSSAIWAFAPEKVLAMRADRVASKPGSTDATIRALWRAGRWLSDPANRTAACEILARPGHLDLPAEVIDRALSGRLVISPRGETRTVPGFVEFHEGAANFPWRSQAAWIGRQLAARHGLPLAPAMDAARAVFRSDIYRRAMAETSAALPGASEKVEGAVTPETTVGSESGRLTLRRDHFFNGEIFDPDRDF